MTAVASVMNFLGRVICVTLVSSAILTLVIFTPRGLGLHGLISNFVSTLMLSFLASLMYCSTFGLVEAIGRTPLWASFIVTTAIWIAVYSGIFFPFDRHGEFVDQSFWTQRRSLADEMTQHLFLIGLCMTCAVVGIGLHEALKRLQRFVCRPCCA